MAHNEERVDDPVFMSGGFAFPPSQHENLPLEPEKKEVQNIKEIGENRKSASKVGYLRWSIYVAAAVVGIVVLGRQLDREKFVALHFKWRIRLETEKMKRYFGSVTPRLKSFIEGGSRKGSEIYRLVHQEVRSCITHQEKEIEIEKASEN